MRHYVGTWEHGFADDAAWMAHEVDAERNVPRRIERVPSGRIECREAALEGWPSLSDQPFPEPDKVPSNDPTLAVVEVTAKDLEERWREDLTSPERDR